MRPARFVTWCFVYCGAVLLASWAVSYGPETGLGSLAQLGVALAILATGVHRLLRPEIEENNPESHGAFTYAMVLLSLLLTIIFLARVFLL